MHHVAWFTITKTDLSGEAIEKYVCIVSVDHLLAPSALLTLRKVNAASTKVNIREHDVMSSD